MRACILDTETVGMKAPPGASGICDLALMVIDNDSAIVYGHESLIDPECPISPSASGVHHITDDMVADQPTLSEYAEVYGNPLVDYECGVVIGHNVAFDLRFLGDFVPSGVVVLDTLKLSRLTWPELENHKLQTLRYHFKLDAGEAHRAMGDVVTTHSLVKLLCDEHETDLSGLVELSKKPLSLDTKMPFGKHKDVALKDLPLNYVRWLLETADIDPDLKQALKQRIN